MKWLMDAEHTVHASWCESRPTDSQNYNVKVMTGTEMLANIASLDFKDGHRGANILQACQCVTDMARLEQEMKADA